MHLEALLRSFAEQVFAEAAQNAAQATSPSVMFRDQLVDVAAFLPLNPKPVGAHVLRISERRSISSFCDPRTGGGFGKGYAFCVRAS